MARLLVIDDEPKLLDLLRRYLERLGYEVDTCPDSQQALARYTEHSALYNLIITDFKLDHMNGEQLLERMREVNPNLRAILCSGIPYETELPNVGFLQKPFLPKMLVDAVEAALKV